MRSSFPTYAPRGGTREKAYNVDGMSFGERLASVRQVLLQAIDSFQTTLHASPEQSADLISLCYHDMMRGFDEAIPHKLQDKLPWKTIINLINSGLKEVGLDLFGINQPLDPSLVPAHYIDALKAALDKVNGVLCDAWDAWVFIAC